MTDREFVKWVRKSANGVFLGKDIKRLCGLTKGQFQFELTNYKEEETCQPGSDLLLPVCDSAEQAFKAKETN